MTESEIKQWRESRTLYPQTTFQALRGPDAGDCIRAAVCTLLQIDPAKLTNWMTLGHDGWSIVMERELAAFGWHLYPLPFDHVASADPEIVCVLQGTTSSGFPIASWERARAPCAKEGDLHVRDWVSILARQRRRALPREPVIHARRIQFQSSPANSLPWLRQTLARARDESSFNPRPPT